MPANLDEFSGFTGDHLRLVRYLDYAFGLLGMPFVPGAPGFEGSVARYVSRVVR
jgi:hypothetical protein